MTGLTQAEEPGRGNQVIAMLWPYMPELRGYLRKRLPPAEIDDVVQDILVRLVRRGDAGAVEFPRRYLYQVAQATLIDRHRQERSRCVPFHCELGEARLPHDELSPDRFVLARDEIRMAQEVLARLPERTRQILLAVRIEGASLKEAAARHGISTSAVEKHLSRALRALSESVRAAQPPALAS
ncbi:MAG: RNA polymerase sigma factor [Phenylobacterium sp.]|uniref:RNA polymerase sigma factor n=1 Tax=Phenylobacterium sp. TaxID=1871053 RepID=UPI003919BA89